MQQSVLHLISIVPLQEIDEARVIGRPHAEAKSAHVVLGLPFSYPPISPKLVARNLAILVKVRDVVAGVFYSSSCRNILYSILRPVKVVICEKRCNIVFVEFCVYSSSHFHINPIILKIARAGPKPFILGSKPVPFLHSLS